MFGQRNAEAGTGFGNDAPRTSERNFSSREVQSINDWKRYYEKSRHLHEFLEPYNAEQRTAIIDDLKASDPYEIKKDSIERFIIEKSTAAGFDEEEATKVARAVAAGGELPPQYESVSWEEEGPAVWKPEKADYVTPRYQKSLKEKATQYTQDALERDRARGALKMNGVKSLRVLYAEMSGYLGAKNTLASLGCSEQELLAYAKKHNLQEQIDRAAEPTPERPKKAKKDLGKGYISVDTVIDLENEQTHRSNADAAAEPEENKEYTKEEILHRLILQWNQARREDPKLAGSILDKVGRLVRSMRAERVADDLPMLKERGFKRITESDLQAYIDACLHDGIMLGENAAGEQPPKNIDVRPLIDHHIFGGKKVIGSAPSGDAVAPDVPTKEGMSRNVDGGVHHKQKDTWREYNKGKSEASQSENIKRLLEKGDDYIHYFLHNVCQLTGEEENVWRRANNLPLWGNVGPGRGDEPIDAALLEKATTAVNEKVEKSYLSGWKKGISRWSRMFRGKNKNVE